MTILSEELQLYKRNQSTERDDVRQEREDILFDAEVLEENFETSDNYLKYIETKEIDLEKIGNYLFNPDSKDKTKDLTS